MEIIWIIVLVATSSFTIASHLNFKRLKKRFNTLEIVLAKKNILTWNDPARELNDEDKKLLKELSE